MGKKFLGILGILLLLTIGVQAQSYDHFSLDQIRSLLDQAMIEAGIHGINFNIEINPFSKVVTFFLEIGNWSRANPDFSQTEFAAVVGSAAGGVGDITANTSWKSDRMNVTVNGIIAGFILTRDCRIAMSLPTFQQKGQYILDHFRAADLRN